MPTFQHGDTFTHSHVNAIWSAIDDTTLQARGGPLYALTGYTADVDPDDEIVGSPFANLAAFEAAVNATYPGERVRLAGWPHAKAIGELRAEAGEDGTLLWVELNGLVDQSAVRAMILGPLYAITGYTVTIPTGDTVVGSPFANLAAFEAAVDATYLGQTVRLAQGDQLSTYRAVALYGGGFGWDSEDD